MRYYQIKHLLEGFREVERKFIDAGATDEDVKKVIASYRDLVDRNQIKGNERNIDWWGKNKSFQELASFVNDTSKQSTKTQQKRGKAPGKSITLADTPDWLVVIPLDKEASCFHGRGSSWCTTKPNQRHFERYFYDQDVTLIYCLHKKDGGMYAIAAHKSVDDMEMFDKEDRSINEHNFKSATGFDPRDLVAKAHAEMPEISTGKQMFKDYRKASSVKLSDSVSERDAELEKMLAYTKDPGHCAEYLLCMKKANIDWAGIPEPIVIAGISEIPDLIDYMAKPTAGAMLAAIQREPFKIKKLAAAGNVINKKMMVAALTHCDEYYNAAKLIDWAIDEGFELDETVVRETFKGRNDDPIGWAFFARDIPVPDDIMLETVSEYASWINDHPEWMNKLNTAAQAVAVRFEPEFFDYIDKPSPEIRAIALGKNGKGIVRQMFYKGLSLTPEEIQKLTTDYSVPMEYLEGQYESVVDDLESRVIYMREDAQEYHLKTIRKLQKQVDGYKAALNNEIPKIEDPKADKKYLSDIVQQEINKTYEQIKTETAELKELLAKKNKYTKRLLNLRKNRGGLTQ